LPAAQDALRWAQRDWGDLDFPPSPSGLPFPLKTTKGCGPWIPELYEQIGNLFLFSVANEVCYDWRLKAAAKRRSGSGTMSLSGF